MSKKIEIEDAPDLAEAEMENQKESDFPYVAISTSRLANAGRHVCCDVFIQLSKDKMTRIFSKESGLDFSRLTHYIDKGVTEVLVRKEDLEDFYAYLGETPAEVLKRSGASKKELADALLDLADQSVCSFYEKHQPIDSAIEKTKILIRNMISSMGNEEKTLAMLLKMVKHHDYLLEHSMTVSIVSMLVAAAAQQSSEKTLEIVGMGGFLHDIGKTRIATELVENREDLSPEQLKEYRLHPKLGARMLEKCPNVPEEVKLITLQHHEEPGGGGYPEGLRGPTIFYLAKVVAVANAFAGMITPLPGRPISTADQALIAMRETPGKFDRDLLDCVTKMFGKKISLGH